MIDVDDLNIAKHLLTEEQKKNLIELAKRLTLLEAAFGSLFKITSGFRNIEDQYHIYRLKGVENPPLHSAHLTGEAADIYDAHKTLKAFLLSEKGYKLLEDLGVWCESFDSTPNWVHCQIRPPASDKRFFLP